MTTPPSTPIADAPDVSKAEREAIAAKTPPYDGVHTYGDLLTVRDRVKAEKKTK